jgi:hypothetical protein
LRFTLLERRLSLALLVVNPLLSFAQRIFLCHVTTPLLLKTLAALFPLASFFRLNSGTATL